VVGREIKYIGGQETSTDKERNYIYISQGKATPLVDARRKYFTSRYAARNSFSDEFFRIGYFKDESAVWCTHAALRLRARNTRPPSATSPDFELRDIEA